MDNPHFLDALDEAREERDRLRAENAALREAGEGLGRLLDLNVDHLPGGSSPEGDPGVTIALARWREASSGAAFQSDPDVEQGVGRRVTPALAAPDSPSLAGVRLDAEPGGAGRP